MIERGQSLPRAAPAMTEGEAEQPQQPAAPSQLDDFTFMQRIGHGSFGTVHKVKRKGARRPLSSAAAARICCCSLSAACRAVDGSVYVIKQVKILAMSRKEQEAAINEVRILASLDSPYVIKYYDSFIDGDSLNIVMELAEHGNLSTFLKVRRRRACSLRQALAPG